MVRTVNAKTRQVVLVCGKCTRKVDGGFGKKGARSLAGRLAKLDDSGKGRKSGLLVIETGCLKLCPKNAVVAINAAQPDRWLVIPVRTDLETVTRQLGLRGS